MADKPLTDKAKKLLTEEISTGGAPAVIGREQLLGPGIEAQRASVSVLSTEEYVAGGLADPLFAYARALPSYIDDRTRALGPDLYEKMATDPHIAGESRVYKLAVLAGGVQVIPALDGKIVSEGDDGYELAREIADLCRAALDDLETPLIPVVLDMLDAFGQGNRVAEIIYRDEPARVLSLPGLPTLSHPARLMLDKLKPKHRDVVAFVVDNRKNHIGYLGALAGRSQYVTRPEVLVDPAHTPNLLPKSKFLTLSWWQKNSDPRGQSQYEPAYDPWWLKQNTLGELAKFIAQFAGAALVGETAEGARAVERLNAAGEKVLVDPTQQLLEALIQFRNGAALAVPHGSNIKNLVSTGAAEPFFSALDFYDKQMSKAILGQTLATNEGKRDNRASSGNAKDVMDLLIEHGEDALSTMLRRELLRTFLTINRGEVVARRLCPVITFSGAEEADWSQLATAGAAIADHLAPNQWAYWTTRKLSLPQPEDAPDRQDTKDDEQKPGE